MRQQIEAFHDEQRKCVRAGREKGEESGLTKEEIRFSPSPFLLAIDVVINT